MRTLILAGSIFIAGGLSAQQPFTGSIRYDVKWSGEGIAAAAEMLPSSYVVTVGKQKVKTVTVGGMVAGMLGDVIADASSGQTYFVNHTNQTVHVVASDSLNDGGKDQIDPDLKKTKDKAVILGLKCVKYTATSNENGTVMTRNFWITEDISFSATPGSNGLAAFTLNGIKGVILKAEIQIIAQGQNVNMVMTASEIKPNNVPDAEFEFPLAYKVNFGLPDMLKMGQ